MAPFILNNINELVTMEPLAKEGRGNGIKTADLGRVGPKAWLAVDAQGKVAETGVGAIPAGMAGWEQRDAGGALVMPGLIDSHTHPIFAGSRAGEFCRRAAGATYQEIAAAGGGILATVRPTRAAPEAELLAGLSQRLKRWLRLGVTTVEAKSGYGLSVPHELRLLRALTAARQGTPQTLVVTCLALHAKSPEQPTLSAYARQCTEELLPVVAAEGLAQWVDAFIDDGYFTVKDVEPYARKARELGLGLRLHADEFCDVGAAAAAADWGAASADHLQYASAAGIAAMARRGVVATLLPGTSLYTKIPFTGGRTFADAGAAVAVATDFNPGSCGIDNLAMMAGVACVQSGLRMEEAVAGVTYVAAKALGVEDRKGALREGMDADFLVQGVGTVEEWIADFGRTEPKEVWIAGKKITSRG